MTFTEKTDLENNIREMRAVLNQPALPIGDLSPLLKGIVSLETPKSTGVEA